jgi:hypothetical protein
LMVIATPSILSGFTWPLSQMPVWVQAISMWFLSLIFWKLFGFWLLRTFFPNWCYLDMVIVEQFAGFYPILLCILKKKCFKGSLNTLFFKSKGIKIMPFAFNPPTGYILISRSRSCFPFSCLEVISSKCSTTLLFPIQNLCR